MLPTYDSANCQFAEIQNPNLFIRECCDDVEPSSHCLHVSSKGAHEHVSTPLELRDLILIRLHCLHERGLSEFTRVS